MNAERWRQVEELFHQAADLSPVQRAAFLDAACAGDEDLRRDVEALLAHDATHDGAMQAAVGRAVEQLPDTESETTTPLSWMPATIGRYRILRLVAEGGMGIVYEAEQEQPRRIVALKVIKPNQATPELLRRFDQESHALARLQHPGIAQIYEAGTADTGFGPQPYFAMEFIRGQSLLDYAEAHGFNTRQRLDLMVKICEAVQHAHQRGLIHRDLKPGNILVDETGQPKILDFGIARATDSDAQAATRQTDVGQLVGTLAYMSPEQVLGEPLEIDTRSDVYALGVVLFELLAGRLPYKISGQLHQAVQAIRETDPAMLSSISRVYRGDIETIAAKALEKDKSHRYSSAAGLGDDIRRHLNDEPIIARPPSATYQLQKFARRHKALVAGMAAVFVALIAGIISSTWEVTRARRAEQTATAVDEFLRNDLLAQASANVQARPDTNPDANLKVRTALDRAAARIEGKFREQPLVEAAIRQTIGNTYRDLGLYPEAQRQLERAVDLRRRMLGARNPKTLETMSRLGRTAALQGRYPQAESLFSQTLEIQRRMLGPEHPDTLYSMSNLANVYYRLGKYAKTEALYSQALEVRRRVLGPEHPDTLGSMTDLANVYYSQGKYAQAEAIYSQNLQIQRRVLGPEHPDTLRSMSNLADVYYMHGNYEHAEALYSQTLQIQRRVLGPEHPNTLRSMSNLVDVYHIQGTYAQAEALSSQTTEISRRVLGPEHPDTLRSMYNLAKVYCSQGKFAQAEALSSQTLEVQRRVMGPEHGDTLLSMVNLADAYEFRGDFASAVALCSKELEISSRVLGPEHPLTLAVLAQFASIYQREGKYTLAETRAEQVLAGRRHALGSEHSDTMASAADVALARLSQGKFVESEALAREALEFDRKNQPDDWQRFRAGSLLGASLAGQKKYAEAEPLLLEGYRDMLARKERIAVPDWYHLDRAGEWIVQLYQRWGKPEKAAMWQQKLQAAKASVAKKP